MNAPALSQRTMDQVLKSLSFVRVYLNDIVIFSESLDENLDHLVFVLKRISGCKLKVELSNCCFEQREINFWGML